MEQKFKGTPPRLPVIFQRHAFPLYFVTFNTLLKRPVLANDALHRAFRDYAERGLALNAATGRYVLMPDHVHVFVRIGPEMTLSRWVSGLKQWLGKSLVATGQEPTTIPLRAEDRATGSTLQLDRAIGSTLQSKLKSFWQPGFFDHLLRQAESYGEKWDYVWRNPVRAKLVARPEDWPYQGEICQLDRDNL